MRYKKDKRFSIKHNESLNGDEIAIVIDTITGVNNIAIFGFGPICFSPLSDENGNVVIDK